jgi:hypothetical protein
VVPYIPALIEYLNYHIYINVCSSVTIFMYLFKYLFKGPDQTHFVLRAMSNPEGDKIMSFRIISMVAISLPQRRYIRFYSLTLSPKDRVSELLEFIWRITTWARCIG